MPSVLYAMYSYVSPRIGEAPMAENQDWKSGFKRYGHQLDADLEELKRENEDLNKRPYWSSSYNGIVEKISEQFDILRNESHNVGKNPDAKEALRQKMDDLSEEIGETLDGIKEEQDELDDSTPLVDDVDDGDVIEHFLSEEG